jgi:uncharacterized SAM-binding protein YcdF (DUF218 family)
VDLHKILPIFLLPVGLVLALLALGLLLGRRWIIGLGFSVLLLLSTPFISNSLMRYTEGYQERTLASIAPKADAIVVLSGGRITAPGEANVSEWDGANRFYGGVELFKAGKAPLLVFTGGWDPLIPNALPEGELLISYAQALGVPQQNMVTTGTVINTQAEAMAVAELLQKSELKTSMGISAPSAEDPALTSPVKPSILLVTSAYHMERSTYLFERQNLVVIPFPVGFQVSQGKTVSAIDFLPSAKALSISERALRELYGRIYYKLVY